MLAGKRACEAVDIQSVAGSNSQAGLVPLLWRQAALFSVKHRRTTCINFWVLHLVLW